MAENGRERLEKIAADLRSGATVPPETVRTILSWFNQQRRGVWVVSTVRQALESTGLVTEPDFEGAYIDSPVYFKLAQEPKPAEEGRKDAPDGGSTGPAATPGPTATDGAPGALVDPSYRLSKLAAANRPPTSVKPDASLTQAITVMLSNDFSQLPVMTTERDVKGMISWKSIASRLSLGKNGTQVREFMEPAAVLHSDASLFAAIQMIVEHNYVLVQAPDRKISGIITSSDLSLQFRLLTEPFLLLSEIENHIRRIIGGCFSSQDLAAAKDPADQQRVVASVSDMTFGEYIRLLENPDKWSKLNVKIDRQAFVDRLKQVRDIRNDVMHFDPDGIPEEDVKTLRDFARFFQHLQDIGVT